MSSMCQLKTKFWILDYADTTENLLELPLDQNNQYYCRPDEELNSTPLQHRRYFFSDLTDKICIYSWSTLFW